MQNTGPAKEIKREVRVVEMDNVGDELHDGKAQLTQRDDGDVIGDGSDGEVRPKMEDDAIDEPRKNEFVLKTREESQADVWIKAGGPLPSEGSVAGRWNKVEVSYAEKGTLAECGKKPGVLTSEKEFLLGRNNGGVNGERVEQVQDVQENSMWRCKGRF